MLQKWSSLYVHVMVAPTLNALTKCLYKEAPSLLIVQVAQRSGQCEKAVF